MTKMKTERDRKMKPKTNTSTKTETENEKQRKTHIAPKTPFLGYAYRKKKKWDGGGRGGDATKFLGWIQQPPIMTGQNDGETP